MNDFKPNFNSDEDDGQYPWEDVDSARNDKRLQSEHPQLEAQSYIEQSGPCPKCGKKAKDLTWFYFSSPEETWGWLCGSSGWMAVCDSCHLQVCYIEDCVS